VSSKMEEALGMSTNIRCGRGEKRRVGQIDAHLTAPNYFCLSFDQPGSTRTCKMNTSSIETSTKHPNKAVKAIVDAPTKQFDGRNMMFRPQNNALPICKSTHLLAHIKGCQNFFQVRWRSLCGTPPPFVTHLSESS
jgi:hypothetical protein